MKIDHKESYKEFGEQFMKDSNIDYNYDHFLFNILIPYTEDLNFNVKLMAGASDVDKEVYNSGYKQNIFDNLFNRI